MNRLWTRRPMRAVAVALAVCGVGAFGLIQLAKAHDAPHGRAFHAMAPAALPPAGLPLGGPMAEHLFDEIGATADQRARLQQIADGLRQDLAAAHDRGRDAAQAEHARLAALFAAADVDAAAVERLRRDALARREADGQVTSQRITQALLEAAQVLSPAQRQQVAARLAQMPVRGPAGRHGDGPRGHRHGAGPAPAASAPAATAATAGLL
ncbi:Spy/CpxP family protein refolding chaperone [Ideonella sp.]|uniref:Spy/CpxP family protein refolding chaperone n=1 Tax=Ideonella sp. TaxID=1929293 RepID=UPI0035B3D4A8